MKYFILLSAITSLSVVITPVTTVAQVQPGLGYGQVVAPGKTMSPQMIESLARYSQRMSDKDFENLMDNAKLSPGQAYLLDGWQPASFTLKNGTTKKSNNVRYNVVLRRLEVRDSLEERVKAFYTHDDLQSFILGRNKQSSHTFEFLPYSAGKTVGPATFFETITSGAIRLLLLHELDVHPEVRNEALNIEIKPAEYYRITRLFVLIEGQKSAYELALNRRAVLRAFGARAKEADNYATEKHLDFTNINDVLRLVEQFNVATNNGSLGAK